MKQYKLISADNHLNTPWLPKDLWQDRLPSRLKEQGPKVVEADSGSYWCWEGTIHKVSAEGSNWHRLVEDEFSTVELPEKALPPSDPSLVREHMDIAGIYAAVFFGDTRKWQVNNKELRLEMYRAYNDFCLELSEFEPGKLIYLPNLPTENPPECLVEFRRVVEAGALAVEFSVFDAGLPLASNIWDPLWEAAAAMGVVICSHTGHRAGTPFQLNEQGAKLAGHSSSPFVAARPVAEMIFGGVFEHHPKLQWVMAECRIGWLPFLFSWMDRQWEIRPADKTIVLTMPPSEYVRRNIRFTFEDDMVGARLLQFEWSLLAETIMWGCDYPHPQGVWPNPEPVIERLFDGINADLTHKILFNRAARLFRINITDVI